MYEDTLLQVHVIVFVTDKSFFIFVYDSVGFVTCYPGGLAAVSGYFI